jgi:acetoin utilization deacetylase AcuC-like enzyme
MAIHQHLQRCGLMAHLMPLAAEPAAISNVLRAHEAAYVEKVLSSAPRHEGELVRLDADTSMNAASVPAALMASGAAIGAVRQVCEGRLQRAFCSLRPPGHHAESWRAMGFCIFNHVAVAARYAVVELGLKRVAVVDWDVHHGNGTEQILAGDSAVFMLHSFQSPLYPYCGDLPRGANCCNLPLPIHSDGSVFRKRWLDEGLPALRAFDPELILVSAGFDAHRDDPLAQLEWNEEDYAWATQQLVSTSRDGAARGRIVSLLEGGYNLRALVRSVEAHLRAMLND